MLMIYNAFKTMYDYDFDPTIEHAMQKQEVESKDFIEFGSEFYKQLMILKMNAENKYFDENGEFKVLQQLIY